MIPKIKLALEAAMVLLACLALWDSQTALAATCIAWACYMKLDRVQGNRP